MTAREIKRAYFQARYQANAEKVKARSSTWGKNNPDKRKAITKKWREKNPEKASGKIRRAENPDTVKSYYREYTKTRRKTDPQFWLVARIRSRMNHALGGRAKSHSSITLLGCTGGEALAHIISQFAEGMTLANRGKVWHVDHIKPLASFDLQDPDQYAKACHYTNLQPLFKKDNLSKGASLDWTKPPQSPKQNASHNVGYTNWGRSHAEC
jgi:hypothetical protein